MLGELEVNGCKQILTGGENTSKLLCYVWRIECWDDLVAACHPPQGLVQLRVICHIGILPTTVCHMLGAKVGQFVKDLMLVSTKSTIEGEMLSAMALQCPLLTKLYVSLGGNDTHSDQALINIAAACKHLQDLFIAPYASQDHQLGLQAIMKSCAQLSVLEMTFWGPGVVAFPILQVFLDSKQTLEKLVLRRSALTPSDLALFYKTAKATGKAVPVVNLTGRY